MRRVPAIGLLACWSLVALGSRAAATAVEPLFADHDPVVVRIEAPFSAIFADRGDDAESHPGVLTYTESDGSPQALDVKLKIRGIFRRQRDICEYPPLRVNFQKKQVEGTLFAGQDKLKLVTHCGRNQRTATQLLLKEYLAYRIFNQITERSFRVRLLELTYAEPDKRELSGFAFLIEDDDSLAKRNGASVEKVARIRLNQLDPVHTSLVEVFQFLIGNTDFATTRGPEDECCHNAVPISSTPGSYYVVPYDFDFAGLVAAPYATPPESLGIRNVRERLYRGLCQSNDFLPASLERFREARAAISALPTQVAGMDGRSLRSTRGYIDQFYAIIDDPRRVDRELRDRCR